MFQSKPSLPKFYDESSKKLDRDPRGAFRNPTDFAGAAAGIVGPLGSSSFNLPNVERALSEMEAESDLQIHLLLKVLLEDLEEAKQAQLDCPHWAPRLHAPVLVVCVHLGHRQLIPARLAQQDGLSMRFCKISFKVC